MRAIYRLSLLLSAYTNSKQIISEYDQYIGEFRYN